MAGMGPGARPRWRLASCLLALALFGCGRGPTLTRTVRPASLLPLRTFPSVWVATSSELDALRLADAVVLELNQVGPARARRVELASLEPARAAGRIPAGTAVLRLSPSFEERMDSRVTERPQTVCGPFGCYQESHTTEYEVPVLDIRLEVVVHDGPSATELARFVLRGDEEGRDFGVLRTQAVTLMAERLMAMIDPEARTLRARLLTVTHPSVEHALDLARAGQLTAAREALTAFVASDALTRLSPTKQAAVLYDLAIAIRFDPAAPEGANARARELLQRAVTLDPRRLYDRALADLSEDDRRAQALADQRAAAEHNFALGRGETPPDTSSATEPPPPPAGYH